MRPVNRRVVDLVLAVVLALSALLLYRKITRLWWTYDDAYLLRIAAAHPARDHFAGGAIWRAMPQQLFTPLLTASYDAELSLFGPAARSFYEVHLVLIAVLAVVIFATARLWLPPPAAAVVALIFIAGVPMVTLSTELMLVHYIESIILGSLSIALFVLAIRRSQLSLSIASAALYLLAMLAKEIAVPLAILVLLLPEGTRRQRLRAAIPHFVALVLYLAWRWAALGKLVGGYGWSIRAGDVPQVAASLPGAVLVALEGHAGIAGVALLTVIAVGIALRVRSLRDALLIGSVLLLSIGPTLPMAKKFESRFAVVAWLACSAIAVAGFMTLRNGSMRSALLIAAPLLAIAVNRQVWSAEFRQSRRMSDEARVFFDLGAGDAIRNPAVPPAAMGELRWLKEAYLRKPAGAQWFYDDLFLCGAAPLPRRVFHWSDERREVVPMGDITTLRDRYCASIRDHASLSVSFHHEGDSLFWNLGPYDRGAYGVVMDDGVQAFEIPRRDGFRLPGVRSLALRIRYQAPQGWVTYSPVLQLDFSRQRDFSWQR